jgi:hypothetical protein
MERIVWWETGVGNLRRLGGTLNRGFDPYVAKRKIGAMRREATLIRRDDVLDKRFRNTSAEMVIRRTVECKN